MQPNRQGLFGEIVNGEMRLNDAVMILKSYGELAAKFPVIDGDAFGCIPNHIHCTVGADLRVRPDHIDDNQLSVGATCVSALIASTITNYP